jgi:hypothetical protein
MQRPPLWRHKGWLQRKWEGKMKASGDRTRVRRVAAGRTCIVFYYHIAPPMSLKEETSKGLRDGPRNHQHPPAPP